MRSTLLFPAVAVLAASSSISCSFVFVEGPPAQHQSRPFFDCTSSRLAPVVDVTLGAVYGIAAVDAYGGTGTSNSAFDRIGPAALAAVMLGSAVYGFKKTAACREAKDELTMRLFREREQGQRYPRTQSPPGSDPWLQSGPPPGSSPWSAGGVPDGGTAQAPSPWGPAAPPSVVPAVDGGAAP